MGLAARQALGRSSGFGIAYEKLISIFTYAFSGCSNLTKITVEEGNPKYDSREGCNAIIARRTNALMCGCRDTVIPSSVTAIRYGAFECHTGLCEIVVPEGVTEISEDPSVVAQDWKR